MIELADGIFVFKGAIPGNICDELIEGLDRRDWYTAAREPGVKELNDYGLEGEGLFGIETLRNSLLISLNLMLDTYREYVTDGHKIKTIDCVPSLRFIRYEKGAGMKTHFDSLNGPSDRVIVSVCYLNGDYEGGEIHYPKHDITVKPEKGDIAFHPGIYTHPHESMPIIEGRKYICFSIFGLVEEGEGNE